MTQTLDTQDLSPVPLYPNDIIHGLWIQVTQKDTMMGEMCKCFTYHINVEAQDFKYMVLHYATHSKIEDTKIVDIGFLLERGQQETALPPSL